MFATYGSGLSLRSYQKDPAYAIIDSVLNKKGYTFVIIFPRQSGKNELQAQIETYLLTLLSSFDIEIVKVSPTWKPQSLNAMRRLERVLKRNLISNNLNWSKEQGYIYRIGNARVFFLSGSPTSNVVGATANALLECDEAQDILQSKWDKEIAPMAASTNATRVFWGTSWTSQTLLYREMQLAYQQESVDGIKRVFKIDADVVGEEVPAYKTFCDAEVIKHGRNHPFIKTQFFSEEIDFESGMFPPDRLNRMQGDHHALDLSGNIPPNYIFVFTIDVAGQDESASTNPMADSELVNPSRDSTALTIFDVDLSPLGDELINAPLYRTHARYLWTGLDHTILYIRIKELIDKLDPRFVVVDATAVGEGLASFLDSSYPNRVISYKFSSKSKSLLGWSYLSVIETGRYKEHLPIDDDPYQNLFWLQCKNTQMDILPGPNRLMRWSVPNSARDLATGELIHDDFLISSALVSVLDNQLWGFANSEVINAYDPLSEMSF